MGVRQVGQWVQGPRGGWAVGLELTRGRARARRAVGPNQLFSPESAFLDRDLPRAYIAAQIRKEKLKIKSFVLVPYMNSISKGVE